jgi:ethanolamine utilization protein EutN
MQLGTVIGRATSTVKHSTIHGWRLLVVQPLDAAGGDDGVPIIAIDALGSGRGDRVIITNDGKAAREMVGAENSPVRWAVIGVADEREN